MARDDSTDMGTGMGKGANGEGFVIGGNGTMAGTDGGAFGILMAVDSPTPPEDPGLGMNIGVGDLLLMVFLRPLRRV